jgi:hypothetical protein
MLSVPDRHLNFIYKLEGDVTEIDVFKLAPTLLAIGELIQEGNRSLYPSGQQIGVNVKPFREGSFVVDMTLFSGSSLQQIIDLFSVHAIDQLTTLLRSIGLITSTTYGAVKLIKFLKGRPKSVEEIGPGEFRYTSIEDKSVTVDGSVHTLISNSKVTTNIYKIYVAPMEDLSSVKDVVTYLKDDPESEVKVDRDDAPIFKEYANPSPVPGEMDETVKEFTQPDVYLNPKRGSFDGDPKDWSFRRGHGEGDIITATIKDKDFLARCLNGEHRLNHNDLLIVDLLERQKIIGTKVQKPTYEIVKVKEYIKGDVQQKLNLT